MATKQVYDPIGSLMVIRRTARRMYARRVVSLRRRYIKAQGRWLFGNALGRAETTVWRKARRSGRLDGAAMAALKDLAAVSSAARNAGLAVLLRDRISATLFRRLTWLWRSHGLRVPSGIKTVRVRG